MSLTRCLADPSDLSQLDLVVRWQVASSNDLFAVADFGITAASLVGTPYESISKQWIENVNSFITNCTFIAHDPLPLLNKTIDTVIPAYAPSTFDAGSPQQFIVNVTSNLASDLSYEPVPADFVSRCE